MTELETLIREALQSRSDDVVLTATSPRPRRSRVLVPLLAASVVLVLALVTALVVVQRHGSAKQEAGGSAGFVGYSWQLVSVTDSKGTQLTDAMLGGRVAFTPDGTVVGDDTINQISARYQQTSGGYQVSDVQAEPASVPTLGADRLRIVTAVDVQFGIDSGTRGPYQVSASVDGDKLVLRRGGYALTFHRAGPQPDVSPKVSAAMAVIGYRWNLIACVHNGIRQDLKVGGAWIAFPTQTSVEGDDTVNAFQGTIRLTDNGFVMTSGDVGAVGGTGANLVVAAFDSVLLSSVVKSVRDDTLTIESGGYTLTFTRAGRVVPDTSVPSPTSTRS